MPGVQRALQVVPARAQLVAVQALQAGAGQDFQTPFFLAHAPWHLEHGFRRV